MVNKIEKHQRYFGNSKLQAPVLVLPNLYKRLNHMDLTGVQANKIIHFTTDDHEHRYGRRKIWKNTDFTCIMHN